MFKALCWMLTETQRKDMSELRGREKANNHKIESLRAADCSVGFNKSKIPELTVRIDGNLPEGRDLGFFTQCSRSCLFSQLGI